MMSEQIADQVSKSGGIGIAEQVYKASLDKMRPWQHAKCSHR